MLARVVPVLVMLLVAASAAAHPGHGDPGARGVLHYLSEPIHLSEPIYVLGALAVAFAVISGAGMLRRRRAAESKPDRRAPR